MPPEWITAFATLAYAFFTGWIILEMRRDRRELLRPIISATVKEAKYPDRIVFTVKNIGKGPALNCNASFRDSGKCRWELQNAIPSIGSNDSVDVEFVIVERDRELGETVSLEVVYSDILRRCYRDTIFQEKRVTMLTKHRQGT